MFEVGPWPPVSDEGAGVSVRGSSCCGMISVVSAIASDGSAKVAASIVELLSVILPVSFRYPVGVDFGSLVLGSACSRDSVALAAVDKVGDGLTRPVAADVLGHD